jgi:hypothetical protein
MKKIVVCTLMLIVASISFCQETPAKSSLTPEAYLKKSKTQKIVGFVFLGAGAITLISVSGGNTDFNTLGTAVVAGGLSVIASIPLFIASGRNKRKAKAAAISFNIHNNRVFEPTGLSLRRYPAIMLKMSL